jgi:Pregnancy-associated plasma protein-A/Secretion system C-terminal sorting domain
MKYPTKVIALFLSILFLSIFAEAKKANCGAQLIHAIIAKKDPAFFSKLAAKRQEAQQNYQYKQGAFMKTTAQVTIPVVFHIVLNQNQINAIGGTAGIQKRIDSQLIVINRDYGRRNADSTTIPSAFKARYANTGIQFCLAHIKPNGTATSGADIITLPSTTKLIEETNINGQDLFYDAKFTNGAFNTWDPTKYLNIWVCNASMGNDTNGILGLTVPPYFPSSFGYDPNEVGVILNYRSWGKRSTGFEPYISGCDKGRTLTHELGHYFNLEHIWGDDNGACPGDAGYTDDGINDTPIQGAENYGCPTFPSVSCSASAPNGDMFMNYMDYSDDICLTMFTTGQVAVMQAEVISSGESYSLTQNNNICYWPAAISSLQGTTPIQVAPNPCTQYCNVSYNEQPTQISVINTLGVQVWSAAPSAIGNNNTLINTQTLASGIYYIHVQFKDAMQIQKIIIE